MEKIKLKIEGMSCQGCVRKIRKALEKIGAKDIRVSLKEEEAEFNLEDKEKISEAKKEIENLGYKVK